MGNSGSQDESNKSGLSSFTPLEKAEIKALFYQLAHQPHSHNKLTSTTFQNHLSGILPEELSLQLFHVMAHFTLPLPIKATLDHVTASHFYTVIGDLTRGSADQLAHVIQHWASDDHVKTLTSEQMLDFAKKILTAYFKVHSLQKSESSVSWKREPPDDYRIRELACLSLQELFYKDFKQRLEMEYTTPTAITYHGEDLIKWLSRSNMFSSMLSYVIQGCFPVFERLVKSHIPLCTGLFPGGEYSRLLDLASIATINHSLPVDRQYKWSLLFDSRQHGESFTNMMRNVKNQGNTVIVVRDTDGHVFGGYNTSPWLYNPSFKGSADNFLFSVSPHIGIYRPTGINSNYFYLNSGQETLPNGLGMGGQFNYFGLWLDCEYGKGHSMAKPLSTTYHSPTLSKQPHFEYHDMEVWKVGGMIDEEDEHSQLKATKSVLDSDPGAKAMLELIGRGNLSDGLRESDPTASNPEEHDKPIGGNPDSHPNPQSG